MKKLRGLKLAACGMALWIAACAIPMGDDLLLQRDGDTGAVTYITDYNLQTYVPIPKPGEVPVTLLNLRGGGDLDLTVVWKDSAGADLPVFPVFQAGTVYRAEIKLTPGSGYAFNPSTPFAYHPGKISAQEDDLRSPTRIVTVTYNNSNDADITYITDYNLQSYVPVPIAGEKPVRALDTREDLSIKAVWTVENPRSSGIFVPIDGGESFVFELGAVYRAAIELTAKEDYRFSGTRNFTYTDGSRTTPEGSESDPRLRKFNVTYPAARAALKISDYNLTAYMAKPSGGMTPAGSFTAPQYTGTVSWKTSQTQADLTGPYQYGTAYTAEVALIPASGYTIEGIGQNFFIHTGAETVTNAAGSGTVTLKFAATSNAPSPIVVYDTVLTSHVPKPVNRASPVTSFTAGQYSGTVVWKNTATQAVLSGSFLTGVTYTAVVRLTAQPGYTFTGIGQNVFTHAGAGSVTNPLNNATVTINFPPTGGSGQAVTSFGPVDAEGSALKLMKEQKDDSSPVLIELPGGVEEVIIPNTVELLRYYNSPVNITIDGGGRTLKIEQPGALLTVRNGITLTLQNITLRGMAANNKPLVVVQTGGRLILENGAVLTGNETTAVAGGVWVNGGELVMNPGTAIERMYTDNPGSLYGSGVLVDAGGKFTMNGGIMEYLAGQGNYSGGGVGISSGSFNMYDGSIQFNTISGVYIDSGSFSMNGGSIRNNTVIGGYICGGGVTARGSFTMNGVDAVIENNHASGTQFAGGVSVTGSFGSFTLIAGTIQGNSAEGPNTAGGVSTDTYLGAQYFTMSGGTIQGNSAEGIFSAGGVWGMGFAMSGGTIKGNRAAGDYSAGGVYVRGTVTMSGGTIGGDDSADANILVSGSGANGVLISSGDQFIMSGGTIKGNYASGTNNYGVLVNSPPPAYPNIASFRMSGSAVVAANNRVFLQAGTVITIDNDLTAASPVANIIHAQAPGSGIHLLKASTPGLITGNRTKFLYDDSDEHIGTEYGSGVYYADYQ